MKKGFWILPALLLWAGMGRAQLMGKQPKATAADTVRGSYNEYRSWWDVQHYDLFVQPDFNAQRIGGYNKIRFRVLETGAHVMQVDLQQPLSLDSAVMDGKKMPFKRLEQAYLITMPTDLKRGDEKTIGLHYRGKPKVAVNPPWDGGLIWSRDDLGQAWISVACQGLGASVWWPNKDHCADEPDAGARISVSVPANRVNVSNGRLLEVLPGANYNTHVWEVKAPINNYNITMNVGNYVRFADRYEGLSGPLDIEFWFLEQHADKAKNHLLGQTKDMLEAFEYWFGPYPFYEDGFKLIETPFLGMEHQSGIAYGNGFKNGYLGTDLSGSGWGLKLDYILIHESGHEWFGNNISVKDVADLWVHEGFTTYSEVLYVERKFGKKAANEYALGMRRNILNDIPMIGIYGINREGSGDIYYKGVQVIHTYRQILNDDVKFRAMLHEMNKRFARKTIGTGDVEALMAEYAGLDLKDFFDTYLRSTRIPKLETGLAEAKIKLRFRNVEKGFKIPLHFSVKNELKTYMVNEDWVMTDLPAGTDFSDLKRYYILY